MNENLYVVIPAYNEEENIISVVEEWHEKLVKLPSRGGGVKLLIVDDGSKDSTYKILKELSLTRKLLIPITKKNGGHGSAVLEGYRYAIENGADYIFQTDSDGQTLASEFESFWELTMTQ